MAGSFGPFETHREPGHNEWSYQIKQIAPASICENNIVSRDQRGEFQVTGLLSWEFPTVWSDDWDEKRDGPKVPTQWSMTVGGIEFEVEGDQAPELELKRGVWLTLEIAGLTVWTGPEEETYPYYEEVDGRRTIQSIYDHLRRKGCKGMTVSKKSASPDVWRISIRRRDIPLALEVAPPNLDALND